MMERVRLCRKTVMLLLGLIVIVIERRRKVEFQFQSWSILVKKSLVVRKKKKEPAQYTKGGGED